MKSLMNHVRVLVVMVLVGGAVHESYAAMVIEPIVPRLPCITSRRGGTPYYRSVGNEWAGAAASFQSGTYRRVGVCSGGELISASTRSAFNVTLGGTAFPILDFRAEATGRPVGTSTVIEAKWWTYYTGVPQLQADVRTGPNDAAMTKVFPLVRFSKSAGIDMGPVTVGLTLSSSAGISSSVAVHADAQKVSTRGSLNFYANGSARAGVNLGAAGVNVSAVLSLMNTTLALGTVMPWSGAPYGYATATIQPYQILVKLCAWVNYVFSKWQSCTILVNTSGSLFSQIMY